VRERLARARQRLLSGTRECSVYGLEFGFNALEFGGYGLEFRVCFRGPEKMLIKQRHNADWYLSAFWLV